MAMVRSLPNEKYGPWVAADAVSPVVLDIGCKTWALTSGEKLIVGPLIGV